MREVASEGPSPCHVYARVAGSGAHWKGKMLLIPCEDDGTGQHDICKGKAPLLSASKRAKILRPTCPNYQ